MNAPVKLGSLVETQFGKLVSTAAPTPAMIDLRDIAHRLSVIKADADTPYDYSLAQRNVLAADAVGRTEGTTAALHALTFCASLAYGYSNAVEIFFSRPSPDWGMLEESIHRALGIAYPTPKNIEDVIIDTFLRLRVTELRILRGHATREITAYERAGATALPCSISYWARDKAFDRYIATWFKYADAEGLRLTDATKPAARLVQKG